MKRLFSIMLTLLLLLTACGGERNVPETTGTTPIETSAAPTETSPEGVSEEDTETIFVLTKMTVMDSNGAESWHREYNYDENGFRTAEREISSSGETIYEKKHTAGDDGNCVLTEIFESGKMTAHSQYAYDDQGRVVKEELYENGALIERIEYAYDGHGNHLSMKIYMDDQLQMEWTFAYTYDENGNILTQEEVLSGELYGTSQMTYDENGNCTGSIVYAADGSVQSRTESIWEGSTETRFCYDADDVAYLTSVITYDETGNITFQENQYSGGSTTMTEYTYAPIEIKK